MISINIINKDDPGIFDTLNSLSKLKLKNTEIILVDASNHKLDWIKKKFSFVKWIHFTPTKTQKSSIPEQRNVAIKQSKGEIIVFLDASCVPENKNWLEKLALPITKENEDIVRGSLSNLTNYYTVSEKIGKKVYVTESPTINMAVKRLVFKKIGLFDESFSYGSDMDFTWRATHAGYKIRYIEDAPVSHDFGDTKQNVKRYINYGKARAKLYANHPYYLYRFKNYELKSFAYFIIICLSPIIFIFPAYLLVLLILFLIQIKGNPYKETTDRFFFSYGLIIGFINEFIKKI